MKKIGLRHRLEEALETYGLKELDVAELLGNENLRSYRSSKYSNKGLTSAQLEKILDDYPELNINWVLTGKGEPISKTDKIIKSQIDKVLNPNIVEEPETEYAIQKRSPDKLEKIQTRMEDIYIIVKDIQTRLV